MSDPTRPTRPVDGPPPGTGTGAPSPPGGSGGPPGGPPAPPDPDGPDWQRITIGALIALIFVLGLVLLLVRGADDGDDVATDDRTTTSPTSSTSSTTSTSSTSSTSSSTTTTSTATSTTTAAPSTTTTTTTTAAPPSTIAPDRCTGQTGPNDPQPVADVFYDAWTVDDRACAEQVATEEAIEDLFVFDGRGADWSSEGCEDTGATSADCFFRYEGGSATFGMQYGAVAGWRVMSVGFTAD